MRKAIAILLMMCLGLTGCGKSVNRVYDEALAAYLISEPASFYGENGYVHEVTSINLSDKQNHLILEVSGEVKDNEKGYTGKNYKFLMTFEVTDQSIYQTIDNPILNDSEFVKMEILRLPLTAGNTWKFKAKDDAGNTKEIQAEIESVSEDGAISVSYTAGEYVEKRKFEKGLGVTSFTKTVSYKDAKGISGYHRSTDLVEKASQSESEIQDSINSNDYDAVRTAFEAQSEASVSTEIRELMVDFNKAYSEKINEGSDAFLAYLMPESPAMEKLSNLESMDSFKMTFLTLKILEVTLSDSDVKLLVSELYEINEGELYENKVAYTLMKSKDHYYIYEMK